MQHYFIKSKSSYFKNAIWQLFCQLVFSSLFAATWQCIKLIFSWWALPAAMNYTFQFFQLKSLAVQHGYDSAEKLLAGKGSKNTLHIFCQHCRPILSADNIPGHCVVNGLYTGSFPKELSNLITLESQLLKCVKCFQIVVRLYRHIY